MALCRLCTFLIETVGGEPLFLARTAITGSILFNVDFQVANNLTKHEVSFGWAVVRFFDVAAMLVMGHSNIRVS